MPDYEITAPDGQKYRVTAPEGASEQDALAHLQQQLASAPQTTSPKAGPSVGTGEDLARSAGGGLQSLATSTAGTGGDIREALASGVNWLSGKAGYEIPQHVASDAIRGLGGAVTGGILAGPTSDTTSRAAEQFFGKEYEPQGIPGKAVKTAIQMAPGIVGGPGTLATKAITNVAVPAAASVTAGELGADDLGKAGAAVASSVLAHRLVKPRAVSGALTADDTRMATTESYKKVHDLGVEIKGAPASDVVKTIKSTLEADGKSARNSAPIYGALDDLKASAAKGGITTQKFDAIRQELVSGTQSADGSVRRAAHLAIDGLDDFLAELKPTQVSKGNAQLASELFKEARANHAATKRLEALGGKLDLGDLNAATANSGQNKDNAIRQAIKQLIRPDKYGKTQAQKMGFNAEEIAQMNKIARGTSLGNLVRAGGNLAGGGLGLGALAAGGVGYYAAGGPEGAALPLAGFLLKKGGNALTMRQARKLESLVASRSPEARRISALKAAISGPPKKGTDRLPGLLSSGLGVGSGGLLGLLQSR
jgi:hypothetical protein